ncbi:MAG: sugar transferase [Candidatus Paceibacterota bacterium]|nr:MAG: sugar transferase [Candidatus Paceibacterota bacterium]
MTFSGKKEAFFLFFGDLLVFLASLWLTLFFRYQEIPGKEEFVNHLKPFSILFAVWFLVFFIAGLYEKHTLIFQSKLPNTLLHTQLANIVIAITFFYFIPFFGITPKTNLFIYLAISFILILFWRVKGQKFFYTSKRQNAMLVGHGEEMKELKEEVNNNERYGIKFISSVDLEEIDGLDFKEEVLKTVYSEEVSVIAIDLRSEKVESVLSNFYNLIFSKVKFVDMHKVYEDIFDRVPMSVLKYNWFLENISTVHNPTFDFVKRVTDIFAALVLGLVSFVFYPIVFLAVKLDDGGPVFFAQNRVGQNNKIFKILKFRSMTVDEPKKITKVGSFLRRTRIDELPQLWSVLKGDLSLIGPRPEIPEIAELYEKKVPYYNVRHLIKPGLSGWAQLYHQNPPKFNADFDETKTKLSYDLYYIKNRSLMLDLKIALKTLKALFMTSGI